jgi:hypothetical protein
MVVNLFFRLISHYSIFFSFLSGEAMLREYPQVVKAIFLHVVTDVPGPFAFETVPPAKLINGRPVVFFRTYVGAAVEAFHLGFVTLQGLEYVVQAAKATLAEVPQTSDKWIDLNRDIERANVILL